MTPPGPVLDLSPHVRPAAYVTADLPGIGGALRQRPEDFIVDEIPAYDPCGSGEHVYMLIQKVEMSTLEVVRILARHFGVRTSDVGYAGLKDKKAITRQVFSIHVPGKKPEDFPQIKSQKISVLWTDLHTNKLRRGHLKGNRFAIKVRGIPIGGAITALKALRVLERAGVPNRLGAQRFGALLNNHLIGRALMLGESQRAADEMLGTWEMRDPIGLREPDYQRQGRELYRDGKFAEALGLMPRGANPERAILRALAEGVPVHKAFYRLDPLSRLFYLNGLQSAVFNAVLDERTVAGTLSTLGPGDVAFKHDSGACFAVDDAALAAGDLPGRLERLEVSPTGPMWGTDMMRAAGVIDEQELRALARVGLTPDMIAVYQERARVELKGARRPFRVPIMYAEADAGADDFGPFVRCAFELPPGAFATTVLDEIMKVTEVHSAKDAEP